ncbi:MAG TPA: copper oxidase [Polyangia bacterium]|jgi:FtsP/CotA-like multicopper oxidase with cupredoxin domain
MSKHDEKNEGAVRRRDLFKTGAVGLAGGALLLGAGPAHGAPPRPIAERSRRLPPGQPGRDYLPVVVPNGTKAPFKLVDGVKVFHLIAEEVEHEFLPGLKAKCWGYNGSVHGPLLEAVEHDNVRIYVTNKLPAATTVHWHGARLPNGMDGVGGLTQKPIAPGETFKYEFTLRQTGTLMYHSHHDEMTQMGMGMTGMFVVHPRRPRQTVDRDYAIMLHEWRIDPGARRPNPLEMTDFNVLTMNAKAFPGTAPLLAKTGDRVRLRIGNLSAMDHHPIHLHGHHFMITETDAGPIPESARWPETTVLVPTGSTRTVEFVADVPGDWAMHCHMTHHLMNQMGHGIPNMIGVDTTAVDQRIRKLVPGYMAMGATGMADMAGMDMAVPRNSVSMVAGRGKFDVITMGGMFTILKTRDALVEGKDPDWYVAPADTLATNATEAELARDGIATKT